MCKFLAQYSALPPGAQPLPLLPPGHRARTQDAALVLSVDKRDLVMATFVAGLYQRYLRLRQRKLLPILRNLRLDTEGQAEIEEPHLSNKNDLY